MIGISMETFFRMGLGPYYMTLGSRISKEN